MQIAMAFSSKPSWNHLDHLLPGFMRDLSTQLKSMDEQNGGLLPDLRSGSTILIGSDYSGQHDSAKYESLCFVFAHFQQYRTLEAQRRSIRDEFLSGRGILSYKDLRDGHRARALLPFLMATNSIRGVAVNVLVDKAVQSLFGQKRLRTDAPELIRFSHWRTPVFEKCLRVLHLAGFFLAGLSRRDQQVIWFTDQDDIVANDQRLREFVSLFGDICKQYVSHPLVIQIGTTRSNDGTMDIEDFVAIADLVAGAVSCALTASRDSGALPSSELKVPLPGDLPEKAGTILDWLADLSQPFKRLVLLIEPAPDVGGLRAKHLVFKNPAGTSPAGWHGAHSLRP